MKIINFQEAEEKCNKDHINNIEIVKNEFIHRFNTRYRDILRDGYIKLSIPSEMNYLALRNAIINIFTNELQKSGWNTNKYKVINSSPCYPCAFIIVVNTDLISSDAEIEKLC